MQITFEGKTLPDLISECIKFLDQCTCAGQEEIEKASAPQTQPADTSDQDDAPDTSKEVMGQALRAFVRKHGKDDALAILAKYNVSRASELTDDAQRVALLQELTNG